MSLIIETLENNKLYVKYTGKINIENSNDIKTSIEEKLGNVKELIFDFSEVSYISSAGLRMIHLIYKTLIEQNGSLYIKNPNKDVRNVFEISGFQTFLNII
jgi:anti-sigma B factor antagonist